MAARTCIRGAPNLLGLCDTPIPACHARCSQISLLDFCRRQDTSHSACKAGMSWSNTNVKDCVPDGQGSVIQDIMLSLIMVTDECRRACMICCVVVTRSGNAQLSSRSWPRLCMAKDCRAGQHHPPENVGARRNCAIRAIAGVVPDQPDGQVSSGFTECNASHLHVRCVV